MKRIFFLKFCILLLFEVINAYEIRASIRIECDSNPTSLVLNTEKAFSQSENLVEWAYCYDSFASIKKFKGKGVGNYQLCIYIPSGKGLEGAKIEGLKIPITTAKMKNVKAWLSKDLDTKLAEIDVTNISSSTFKEVRFEKKYDIPNEGIYAGFSFEIIGSSDEENFCLPIAGIPEPGGLYMNIDKSWKNYSTSELGVLPLKVLLSNITPHKTAAYLYIPGKQYTAIDSDNTLKGYIISNSTEPINSFSYNVQIGDVDQRGIFDLRTPIPAGLHRKAEVTLQIKSPKQTGEFQAQFNVLEIDKMVNYLSSEKSTEKFINLLKLEEQGVAVEEFTGTACPNCPRGHVGMEMMREYFGDKFVGIAIHQYNSQGDAMYINTSNYAPLKFVGAPMCMLNRKVQMDPRYGSNGDIREDFLYEQKTPALVGLNITAQWNEKLDGIIVTSIARSYLGNPTLSVEYVLIGDSLTGKGAGWGQKNTYATQTYDANSDPMLKDYYKGGKYGQSVINDYYFNDVALSSSYSGGINKAQPFGTLHEGEEMNNTFTLPLPKSINLKKALNKEQLYAAVLLVDRDGTILNAAKCKIPASTPNVIENIERNDSESIISEVFNLSGQRINTPQKGVNILRRKDGRTFKVIIR